MGRGEPVKYQQVIALTTTLLVVSRHKILVFLLWELSPLGFLHITVQLYNFNMKLWVL